MPKISYDSLGICPFYTAYIEDAKISNLETKFFVRCLSPEDFISKYNTYCIEQGVSEVLIAAIIPNGQNTAPTL